MELYEATGRLSSQNVVYFGTKLQFDVLLNAKINST